MGLLLRILPLCVVAIALWRIIPAFGEGFDSMGDPRALRSVNAASIANSLQGELGAAMSKKEAPAYVGRARLDGWGRPDQLRENGGSLEVVSCGEDGRCGTNDDVIEVVRADGSRERIDASFKKPIPAKPKATTRKPTTRTKSAPKAPAAIASP